MQIFNCQISPGLTQPVNRAACTTGLGEYDFMTVTISFLKSDEPVPTTVDFWELFDEFVRNRSIHDGLVGFLLQVDWLLMIFTS